MNVELQILRELISSNLGTDPKFDESLLTDSFLEQFAEALCQYKKDAKPLYTSIYGLELSDPEKGISKLDTIYHSFINNVAESFVARNNEKSSCSELLIKTQNEAFQKRVFFYKNLVMVVKKVERQRIKDALPNSWEALNFEIPENTLENSIKKQSREKLKQQFRKWDEELNEREVETTKIISFSWLRYAVAASVLFLVGIWVFNSFQKDLSPNDTLELSSTEKQKNKILGEIKQIESHGLVDVVSNQKKIRILENNGIGFINKTQKLKIVIKNPQPRITSIVLAIEQYQKLLETKFAPNSFSGQNNLYQMLENRIDSLKIELSSLKAMQNTYVFDEKILTLHTSRSDKIQILYNEDIYYLNKEDNFYPLVQTSQPKKLEKLNDSAKQEALSKILFDNGF
ncbi:hypothetical protein [Aquirufa sp. OSTEICH-129A]